VFLANDNFGFRGFKKSEEWRPGEIRRAFPFSHPIFIIIISDHRKSPFVRLDLLLFCRDMAANESVRFLAGKSFYAQGNVMHSRKGHSHHGSAVRASSPSESLPRLFWPS
jgi:hypothetical protein